MNTTFSIRALFKNALNDYKKYWGIILIITLTFGLAQMLGLSGIELDMYYETMSQDGFSSLASWFVTTWLTIGYIKFLLNIVDGKQARFRDIFYGVKSVEQFVYYVLVSMVYAALVVMGTVLFIIPGIIIALALVFAQYYIAENRLGFRNALNSSWEITKGNRWKMFGLAIVAVLFNLLGLLAFGIGLLVTIPVTQLVYARLFRTLEGIPLPEGGSTSEEE